MANLLIAAASCSFPFPAFDSTILHNFRCILVPLGTRAGTKVVVCSLFQGFFFFRWGVAVVLKVQTQSAYREKAASFTCF